MQYKHNAPVVTIHNKKEKPILGSEKEFVKKTPQETGIHMEIFLHAR